MRDLLPTLHDAYNRRLRLEVPIRRHTLVRRLVLLFGLLQLDLIDLDPHLGVRKARIVRELVCRLDLLAPRLLAQHPVLGACQ